MMSPYKVLDVKRGAGKNDIIQAAARAMREKIYTIKEIAIAQKALMSTISNAAHEFLDFIDVKTLQGQLNLSQPAELTTESGLEYNPVQGEGS